MIPRLRSLTFVSAIFTAGLVFAADYPRAREGMHAKFPPYGRRDVWGARSRPLTEGPGVNHARLGMGTSMGGMHTWLWGDVHPDCMDALMPLESLPTQISGRSRGWRRMI